MGDIIEVLENVLQVEVVVQDILEELIIIFIINLKHFQEMKYSQLHIHYQIHL
jgi:hypothetical protein